jgi:hypothetical protein
MTFEQAKEKQQNLKPLLDDSEVICLYISPTETPGKFLQHCWDNKLVSPDKFTDALKEGFFEQFIDTKDDVDVFVWTKNQVKLFGEGHNPTLRADSYKKPPKSI